MMGPVAIERLQVVGYADVLSNTVLPSIVPPIFAMTTDPDLILLPPFQIQGDSVWNAKVVSRAEAEAMQRAQEITLFEQPLSAHVDHQMYVDLDLCHHYLPKERADTALAEIASRNLHLAQAAFQRGDLEKAEKHAGIAFCADDRNVSPLVIKAAIRRLRNNRAGEQLMASIAAPWLDESDFAALVDRHLSEARSASVVPPTHAKRSPMACIATYRANAA
jgi:hypothetical protein